MVAVEYHPELQGIAEGLNSHPNIMLSFTYGLFSLVPLPLR